MHLSKPMECTVPRVNPKVLVWDVNNGGGWACVEARVIWDISVRPSQSYCEPKTAQKKKKKTKSFKNYQRMDPKLRTPRSTTVPLLWL